MFFEDKTLQPVLAYPSDLIIDEPVQITKLEPLLVENENWISGWENELEVTLSFLIITTISITAPKPRIIVILDSKEEVETISQTIAKEQSP